MPRPLRSLVLAALALLAVPATAAAASFPRDFLWGVATSAFQTEMGGHPPHIDPRSDWWAWTHDRSNIAAGLVTADRPENGPGSYGAFRSDARLARRVLRANAFRLSIEWSRIFPRSTASVRTGRRITLGELRRLDRLANRGAVRHYRTLLVDLRRRGLTPFVTLNHFTLPIWLHEPAAVRAALGGRGPDDPLPAGLRRAGWLDHGTVVEFRKYAAYLGWKYGKLVDLWAPINEPMVVAISGYVNVPGILAENFPPGAFSFSAAIAAIGNLKRANAAAYDVVKRFDRRSRVGLVQNMIAFTPADAASAADRRAAEHADYLFNRLFLDSAVRGNEDNNFDGVIQAYERRRHARKADFIGVDYYYRGRVKAAAPLSRRIPVADLLPTTSYRTPQHPSLPPCPTLCSDFGSELYPQGFRHVLAVAGRYHLPVYVTENGIADADDRLRRRFLAQHLLALRRAVRDRLADVRGYFHWSLTDNFEWAAGYAPKFGLFTLGRRPRASSRLFGRVARANAIPQALVRLAERLRPAGLLPSGR